MYAHVRMDVYVCAYVSGCMDVYECPYTCVWVNACVDASCARGIDSMCG